MKYSAVAVLVGATALVAAQNPLENIPKCILPCVTPLLAENKSCNTADVACICRDKAFIEKITKCAVDSCEQAQVLEALDFAKELCSSMGVTLPDDLPIPTSPTTTDAPSETAPVDEDDEVSEDEEGTPTQSGNGTVTAPVPTETSPSDSAAGTLMVSGFSLVGAAFAALLML